MQKETNLTVGRWCDRWFCENQGRWSGSTVGGYRNLIYLHKRILKQAGLPWVAFRNLQRQCMEVGI